MKRTLILTFLACAASLPASLTAQAQTPAPTPSDSPSPAAWAGHKHGGQGGGPLERLTNVLGLSGSQEAEIAPIVEAARPQLKAIHDNAVAQRKAVFESMSSQIAPLLTPDQQTRFARILENLENGAGPGGGGLGGGGGQGHFKGFNKATGGGSPSAGRQVLERLTSQLALTPDQQSQIKPILDTAHEQVVAIRQNTALTAEQRFAQIKAAMETARSQVNGILTPAQREEMALLKPEFRPGHAKPSASPSP